MEGILSGGNLTGEINSDQRLAGTANGKQKLAGNAIPRGNDGFSPIIDIAQIEVGTRVTITDINGTKYFDVFGGISTEQIGELIRAHLEDNPPDFNESDPTVPSWAKQPTKPEYTAEEVGALPADSLQPAINEAIAGYATEKWVSEGYQPKGNYLTEVPSGYATEEFVKNKIAEAELSGEEVDLSGYAQKSEIPTKVSQLQNDAGYLTQHQDISGKLDASALPTAINTALAQAKASGEFKGDPGKDGADGQDGYTPVKGVDYFDGADGKDGKDGQDGYTPQKNIDYFDGKDGKDGVNGKDGYTPQKDIDYFDGKDGQPGADGKTPVKGTDYWTAADKSAMVSDVLAALPTWTGGSY